MRQPSDKQSYLLVIFAIVNILFNSLQVISYRVCFEPLPEFPKSNGDVQRTVD